MPTWRLFTMSVSLKPDLCFLEFSSMYVSELESSTKEISQNLEDRKGTQLLFYALKFGAGCQSWQQPINVVTNLLSDFGGQVGSTWACSFSSPCWRSASASLLPEWCMGCTQPMALASSAGCLCHWGWRCWETDVTCSLSSFPLFYIYMLFLAYISQLRVPHWMQTIRSFILAHSSGSSSLVDPWPIEPAYARPCWALEVPMVSQGSTDFLLYRAHWLV